MLAEPGRRAALLPIVFPLAGLAVTVALAVAAVGARRSHRAAAERVLLDDAGVAATELIRRTAFDVGSGYQAVGIGLRRTDAAGALALPQRLPADARALVSHLYAVDHGALRQITGPAPPPGLEDWLLAQATALPADREPFLVRHRILGGKAATLVIVPLDDGGTRVAAFDVDLDALRPYLSRSLDRAPLLPDVIGDGHVTNAVLQVDFLDPAGEVHLRAGTGPWPPYQVTIPFGDFYRGILEGSRVRVSIDPAVAERLLPGGLPGSALPALGVLVAAALALAVLGVLQRRRERAFARLREDFMVSVSHDLRTPLAQIRLFTETVLLERARSPDEARRFLEAAVRETVRLGHLVDNLLDFSRAERGGLEIAPTPRRLAPLVAEVTQAFRPLAATRRVTLEADLDPEAGAAVDEAGFTRLLLNLLDNAVKFGPEKSDVTVRLGRAAGAVELAVEDRGPGVPARDREAIFAPFHRLRRGGTAAATGTGIGLAIVRELAVRHGGSCRVEDRQGGGARFVVRLPGVEVAA